MYSQLYSHLKFERKHEWNLCKKVKKETYSYLNVLCNKQTIYRFLIKIPKKCAQIFFAVVAFSGDKKSNILRSFLLDLISHILFY